MTPEFAPLDEETRPGNPSGAPPARTGQRSGRRNEPRDGGRRLDRMELVTGAAGGRGALALRQDGLPQLGRKVIGVPAPGPATTYLCNHRRPPRSFRQAATSGSCQLADRGLAGMGSCMNRRSGRPRTRQPDDGGPAGAPKCCCGCGRPAGFYPRSASSGWTPAAERTRTVRQHEHWLPGISASRPVDRERQAIMTATIQPATASSADGTAIGYQILGSGEGVILIGGTLRSAGTTCRWPALTVHGMDRREPGVSVAGSMPVGWLADYRRLLTAGDTRGAFAVMARGAGHAPGPLARMPQSWVRALLRLMPSSQWQELEPLSPCSRPRTRTLALDFSFA
jgi:hypothetical protein